MMIESMSTNLGLSYRFIESLAKSASHEYKTYDISKRTGGSRTIHHPSRRLKALQRWLLQYKISHLPLHPAAMAYRKNISTFKNAEVHVSNGYLLRMDLENFFPSIKRTDIERYIAVKPNLFSGWSGEDIEVFCRLVCRHGALSIGAPTSPALSNALCYELDTTVETLAKNSEVTYSRYADDLFFSTDAKDVLTSIADKMPQILETLSIPATLKINTNKTRYSSKRGARRVTGIVLGSDGKAHVGRGLKRCIRALIHRYETLTHMQRASLAGSIAYVAGNDPQFVNSLIIKYGLPQVRLAKTPPR